MVKNSSIIEINGNKYDAVTGQLVDAARRVAKQVKPAAGVIDGFIKKTGGASNAKAARPASQPPAPAAGRQPQKSRTLVRSAVAKYGEARKKSIDGLPKARGAQPKPAEVLRAKTVAKHQKVTRFSASRRSEALVGQVMPPSGHAASGTASRQAPQNLVANLSSRRLEQLLDDALLRADAHRDMLRRQLAGTSPWARFKLFPKWLSIGASLLIVLLLGAFFAWQNIPQVSMKVAASKTHVGASVPAYTPSGFKFAAPVSTKAQAVTIQYQASTDNAAKYTISQKDSNWDSSTLASSVNSQSNQVQTSQVNGTTVYCYGNSNNASWLNQGVLHTLTNQANLSCDEISKIAGSMQ